MKVTIVGAGNVGATCADAIAYQGMASEVVLLDIKEGFAEGKALDMMQTATTLGFNTKIVGTTSDYKKNSKQRCCCDHIWRSSQAWYDQRRTHWN